MTNSDSKQWKLTAITEALGDLELSIEDKLSVGRGQDNDVVLGSKQVSRQHAELTVVDDKLMVQDLGSSNGTLVNNHKLEPHQPTALAAEDTVTFAAFSFRVNQEATTPTIAPAPSADEPEAAKTTEAEQAKQNAEAVERADIEGLTDAELDQKLEEELEGPIAMGDPNQQSHLNSKEQHFEELAAEADPDVHKAKQAAAAQMSATTDLNKKEVEKTATESEVVEPKVVEPKAKADEPKAEAETVEPKAEKVTPVTTQAPVIEKSKEPSLEKDKPAPEVNNSFNTVKEEPQHNVAHVKNSTPVTKTSGSGKNYTFLWLALILVGLAVVLWLYNSGTLA